MSRRRRKKKRSQKQRPPQQAPAAESSSKPRDESDTRNADEQQPASGATAERTFAKPTRGSKPMTRWARWRRRAVVGIAALFVLAVVLRIALWLSLPSIINGAAGFYDLECTYERLDLSILTGDMELWHLVLKPKGEDAEPFVDAEYCRADLAVAELLSGRLVVRRLEVDGMDLRGGRDAEGRLILIEHFLASREARQQEAETTSSEAAGIPLESPITIDALRMQHVKARLRDDSVSPPVAFDLDGSLRLSHLGSESRRTRFGFTVTSQLVDSVQVEAHGTSGTDSLDMDVDFRLRGFHPELLAAYLEPLGVTAVADDLSVDGALHIAATRTAESDRVEAELTFTGMQLRADEDEALALDNARFRLAAENVTSFELNRIDLEGGRAVAGRTETGALELAGFRYVGAAPAPAEAAPAEPATTSPIETETETEAAAPGADPLQLVGDILESFEGLRIRNCRATFRDDALEPSNEVTFRLDDLRVVRGAQSDSRYDITAQLGAPGLGDLIDVRGALHPRSTPMTARFGVEGSHVRASALAQYLVALGIEPILEDGAMAARVGVSFERGAAGSSGILGFELEELSFEDSGERLFALDGARVQGVELRDGGLHVDLVEVTGARGEARRQLDGAVRLLGLRVSPPGTATPATPAPTSEVELQPAEDVPAAAKPVKLPSISVARVRFGDSSFELFDEALDERFIGEAGLELDDFRFGGDASSEGALRAWLRAPGIVDELSADGSLTSAGGCTTAGLTIAGRGITADGLTSILADFGVAPTLDDGSVTCSVELAVENGSDGPSASVTIADFSYADGDRELLAWDSIAVTGAGLRGVESVAVHAPRLLASRRANGTLETLGLRLDPSLRPEPVAEHAEDEESVAATREPPPAGEPSPLPPFRVGKITLDDARVTWSDEAVAPAISMTPVITASLSELDTAPEPFTSAPFAVTVTVPEVLESLQVDGNLGFTGARGALELNVRGDGLRGDSLVGYLPDGISADLADGRFRASLEARLEYAGDAGWCGGMKVEDVDYRDDEAEPLFAFSELEVEATRVDAAAVELGAVTLDGLTLDIARRPDGLHALGLRVDAAAEDEPGSPPVDAVATDEPATSTTSKHVPTLSLQRLALQFDRIAFTDETGDDPPTPLEIVDLIVETREPVSLQHEETDAPVRIAVAGSLAPLAKSFGIELTAAPSAPEPKLDVTGELSGIDATNLAAVFPDLAEVLGGATLTDGRAEGVLSATLRARRRGPLDFELANGFGLAVSLDEVNLRSGPEPDATILAGVKSVRADVAKLDAGRGVVHIDRVEIEEPRGRVARRADGLHLLGLVVPLPEPPTPEEASDGETEEVAAAPRDDAVEPKNGGSDAELPDIRIDELYVTGIDFVVEDDTTNPPMIVPLEDLDVEVRGAGTRALSEPRPIRFSVIAIAGEVPLPVNEDDVERERLFAEAFLSGSVKLHPNLNGWAKGSMSGLHLRGFKGPAEGAGVTLEDGVFDGDVDVRFAGDGSLDPKVRIAFTDLDMNEAPDGPISKYLSLPAPLEVVLFVLRDEEGAIRLPVEFHVSPDGVSAAEIGAVAAKTLSTLIADAVAASPFRLAGSVGDLMKLGDEEEEEAIEPPVEVAFADGDVFADGTRVDLRALIERVLEDEEIVITLRHELGSADLASLRTRANPDAAAALQLARRLRNAKLELAGARVGAAREARSALHGGTWFEAQSARERLQDIDARIGRTERALDRVLAHLRPGADQQAQRRTREAATVLGLARLGELSRIFTSAAASEGISIDDRIRIVRPRFTDPTRESGVITVTVTPRKLP